MAQLIKHNYYYNCIIMNQSRNPKRKLKGNKKANNQVDISNYMSAKTVNGRNDPPKTNKTIQGEFRFGYTPGTGASAPFAFTAQDILRNIPGNILTGPIAGSPLTYWKFLRIVKVSAYCLGTGTGSTAPFVQLNFSGEPRIFTDDGIQGSRSAALHVRPPLSLLQRWIPDTNNTEVLFNASASGGALLIHITAEVISSSVIST